MVRYNTAVMALLKRIGPCKERGLGQLPRSLLRDLTRGTHSMMAGLSFHWEGEKLHRAREKRCKGMAAGKSAGYVGGSAEDSTVPLVAQIPCLLLFLQLPPPRLQTAYVSTLIRAVLFSIPVRGRSPHVNALFTAIILHLLPRPYATVPTVNLILSVITIGAARIADDEYEKLIRRKLANQSPKGVLKENEEVTAFVEELPRWLQALLPKGAILNFSEIIDEIARRLPPAGEGLPGDYVDVLASRTKSNGEEYEYGLPLKRMCKESSANRVTPAELLMLVPKLLDFSVKFNRMQAAAQRAKNAQLLDFSPPVNHEALYSPFACTALCGALSSLSLLRHTEKILAVRELSVYEWLFITSIVTGREKMWASTGYTAMRTALRVAEERRRDEIQRSGKAEREVSLFGSMDAKRRQMVLSNYSNGICELRFYDDLFSPALECTEPLMREYFRIVETETAPSLRALDAKYHIRQMLSVVTRADNLNLSHASAEPEDVTGENDLTAELSRVNKTETTTGHITHCFLRALEKFFADPSSAWSSAAVVPATPVLEKRSSGFARTTFSDERRNSAIAFEDLQLDDHILRMHVVECAIVYCLQLHGQSASLHCASRDLVELSLRSARRMQEIIGVQLRNVSSVVRSSQWKSRAATVARGASSGTPTEMEIVDGVMGEHKSLQLSSSTMKLLLRLTQRKDLSTAEHADVVGIAAAVMTDFSIFMDSISDHRVLPATVNRNLAMFHSWYVAHTNMVKSNALAEDVAPLCAADESARKVVLSCLGVTQRILPPSHHQRQLTDAATGVPFGFHKKLVMVRLFDCALSIALTANMTLNELPNIFDAMEKAVDTIRDASQMALQESPSDKVRYQAEQQLRSLLLPKLMHLLTHICTLSVNDESCLTVAAAALEVCAREEKISFVSWKARESILRTTLYVYRALAERFAHSRASRQLAHQLLIMVSRFSLDSLECKHSDFTAHKQKKHFLGSERELRHLVCAVLMWQISCAVASTFLQSAPLDKYLRIMHTYVKRHFVISMSGQTMEESSTIGTEAELEYCEQVLAELGPSARPMSHWETITTKEAAILRCNLVIGEVFHAIKFMATVFHKDSSVASNQAFRTRYLTQMEVACGLLKQYQRWVAPSVWHAIWRELVSISIVVRIGHLSSIPVQETTELAAQRMLIFSKIRDNKGVWINLRGLHTPASQEDDGADEGASEVKGDAAVEPQLISFSNVSRLFSVQEQLTDVNLRVYLAQLADRLSREQEECEVNKQESSTNLHEERLLRLNGLSETQAELPSHPLALLFLVTGIPGAGKSAFLDAAQRHILQRNNISGNVPLFGGRCSGRVCAVLQLDKVLADLEAAEVHENDPATSAGERKFSPLLWRRATRRLLELTHSALRACMEDTVRGHATENAVVPMVFVEDNMHYRSMRERYYRMCRTLEREYFLPTPHSDPTAAAQLQQNFIVLFELRFATPLAVCLARNAQRNIRHESGKGQAYASSWVPPPVICSMDALFDQCYATTDLVDHTPWAPCDTNGWQWTATTQPWGLLVYATQGVGVNNIRPAAVSETAASFFEVALQRPEAWDTCQQQCQEIARSRLQQLCEGEQANESTSLRRAAETVESHTHQLDLQLRGVVHAFLCQRKHDGTGDASSRQRAALFYKRIVVAKKNATEQLKVRLQELRSTKNKLADAIGVQSLGSGIDDFQESIVQEFQQHLLDLWRDFEGAHSCTASEHTKKRYRRLRIAYFALTSFLRASIVLSASMQSTLEEILRYRAALAVQEELERLCKEHLPTSPLLDTRGLLPSAIFEGHQYLAATIAHPSDAQHLKCSQQTREWVHPILDVHRQADVVEVSQAATTAATRLRLVGMQCVQGDILGVVVPAEFMVGASTNTCAQASPRAVSVKNLRLAVPEPFYHDALLPALEAIEPHRASKTLLDLWLNKLCGAANKMETSFNQKRKTAWRMTDEATYIFYTARKKLAERIGIVRMHHSQLIGERPWELKVHLQSGDVHLLEELSSLSTSTDSSGGATLTAVVIDLVGRAVECSEWVSLREWLTLSTPAHGESLALQEQSGVEWTVLPDTALRLRIPIRPAVVLRLHARYVARQPAKMSAGEDSFLHALARLLLRYHGLCGGRMETEAGCQAAVPPSVMDVFEHHRHGSLSPQRPTVVVECFASPFNATRPFFFSVFHDTDTAFGSLGNFFACGDVAACVAAADAAVGPLCRMAKTQEEPSTPCPSDDDVSTGSLALKPDRLLRLECNPPFVHNVIAAAFAHLLRWLESTSSTTAVSILIIIPDSEQAHAAKVRATIEESRFCRWVRSLPPPESLYVHGADHHEHSSAKECSLSLGGWKRPRDSDGAPTHPSLLAVNADSLVRLSCPTRLIIVQDDKAEHACSGATIGADVCAVWSRLSRLVSSATR